MRPAVSRRRPVVKAELFAAGGFTDGFFKDVPPAPKLYDFFFAGGEIERVVDVLKD